MNRSLAVAVASLLIATTALPATAQERPTPAVLLAAEKAAMAPLAWMDGVWRGTAWTMLASGDKHTVTHTERIGPMLDGSVKVVEGRSYDPDGRVPFNAFGVISFSPYTKAYTLHSYAMGNAGDFPLTLKADGYMWEIPAGPSVLRYTATLANGTWTEVGDQIAPGKDPVRIFEMTLKRVGDSPWPGAGAVPPK